MKLAKLVGRGSLLWKILLVLAAVIIVTVWLAKTPDGLLGKADAIGYAVCHRIDARSFHLESFVRDGLHYFVIGDPSPQDLKALTELLRTAQ